MNEAKHNLCKDSQLCGWLNKISCDGCIVAKMRDKDKQEAVEDFNVTVSHLPDNIDDIFGEECQFCAGVANKTEHYARLDMTHPEPYAEARIFGFSMGSKFRASIGSLLPFDISCCSECRKVFKKHTALKWISVLSCFGSGILAFVIFSALKIIAQDTASWVILFLTAASLLALVVSAIVSKIYIKKQEACVRGSVLGIPLIKELRNMGWSVLNDSANSYNSFGLRFNENRTNGLGTLKSKI